jgi:hypothetical protein
VKERPTEGVMPTKKSDKAFVTEYVHYLTKKVMRASDYGYKAWPLGGAKR